jgi:dATP pyrophosphohydrolase
VAAEDPDAVIRLAEALAPRTSLPAVDDHYLCGGNREVTEDAVTRKKLAIVVITWRAGPTASEKKVLMLKVKPDRGSFWQPVTGGIDEGESFVEGALREAEEETPNGGRRMNRLDLIFTTFLLAPVAPLNAADSPTATPRNMLLIITDQQRFDTLRAHGCPWMDTPHLDRLAVPVLTPAEEAFGLVEDAIAATTRLETTLYTSHRLLRTGNRGGQSRLQPCDTENLTDRVRRREERA